LATERGRAGYDEYRRDFAKLIWEIASPKWDFDAATFDRRAAFCRQSGHVSIVIHNYRWWLSLAAGEPQYGDLESGWPVQQQEPLMLIRARNLIVRLCTAAVNAVHSRTDEGSAVVGCLRTLPNS
jgi:hypothetical protein